MSLSGVESVTDYNKIPQRLYKYPASDRARKIVRDAITMDALFGTAWPVQWSTPDGPEFHDVDRHGFLGSHCRCDWANDDQGKLGGAAQDGADDSDDLAPHQGAGHVGCLQARGCLPGIGLGQLPSVRQGTSHRRFPLWIRRGSPACRRCARARVLRMVREQNVVPLPVAVAKLSYDAAKWFEDMVPDLRHRGRVSAGAIADITIFDPATVTDTATFEVGKNSLPSTGIPYVIVNGVVVVKNSEILKDVNPGRPIRNAPRK